MKQRRGWDRAWNGRDPLKKEDLPPGAQTVIEIDLRVLAIVVLTIAVIGVWLLR
jgi:hypothetical protein